MTTNGAESMLLFLTIAHEMAHGKDKILNGNAATTPWVVTPQGKTLTTSEKYVTHIENQIRSENGLPLRTHYAIDKITGQGWEKTELLNPNGASKFFEQTKAIDASLPLILGGLEQEPPLIMIFTKPFKY